MAGVSRRSRQPAGVPTGGQFAAEPRAESDPFVLDAHDTGNDPFSGPDPHDVEIARSLMAEAYDELVSGAWDEYHPEDNLREILDHRFDGYLHKTGQDPYEILESINASGVADRNQMTPEQALVDCWHEFNTWDPTGVAAKPLIADTGKHLKRLIDSWKGQA